MGKLLEEGSLKNLFRERFLQSHLLYLNAISDILGQEYGKGTPFNGYFESLSKNMTENLLIGNRSSKSKQVDLEDEETMHFRNLRNSWYHECALNYPETLESQMKFPVWKVVQCYYSVLSSISTIVRCLDTTTASEPNKIFNTYSNTC